MNTTKPQTFKEVMNFLSSIPYINMGGCGISALAMYLWLKEHENKEVKFVFCYKSYGAYDYRTNKKKIKNNSTNLIVPQHIVINYKHRRYDCDGKLSPMRYQYSHRAGLKEIIDTVNDIGGWNDMFDRRHISKIEKTLGINLPIKKY